MTEEISLDGSLHTWKNLKIEGQLYTPEVNITNNSNNSNLLGYAFRVNDQEILELIKYSSIENSDKCQLIATFGKGALVDDPNYTFNKYESNTSTLTSNAHSNGETIPSNYGGFWEPSGNDIHFGMQGGTQQRVGINIEFPEAPLHVIGTIKGSELTDGTIDIRNGFIYNVESIRTQTVFFEDLVAPGVGRYWDGHASNLFNLHLINLSKFQNDLDLGDFYKNQNITWFDNEQSNILLSQFSNDILDFGDEVTFCNVTVTNRIGASNGFIENITACNHRPFWSL